MGRARPFIAYAACVIGALTMIRCTPDYPVDLPCGAPDECPPGQVCRSGTCRPDDGCDVPAPCDPQEPGCDPSAADACCPDQTRACGSCGDGQQTCTADGAWGDCVDATEPEEEVCNGLDDDCDGETDDGIDCSPCVPIGDMTVFPVGTTILSGRDFRGHGPDVAIWTTYRRTQAQICADVTVTMKETVTAGLVATSTVTRCATPPRPIKAIATRNSVHGYRDTDVELDEVPVEPGVGIESITCAGDTSGEDLCSDPALPGCSGCLLKAVCPFVTYQ